MAQDAFEHIVKDFEFLDEWHDRYRYVIDLGKTLAHLPDDHRHSGTKVEGCASQVWILPEICQKAGQTVFTFRGESDAMIVRGLIAILQALYNDIPFDEVGRIDAHAELGRLGLREHLTAQRSNGLASMVARIRQLAAKQPSIDDTSAR